MPGCFRCDGVAADHHVGRDVEAATAAIRAARAQARERVWQRRRPVGGAAGSQVIIDLDATLVSAHSEKHLATPTFKSGFGFHPLFAFCDHGADGSGETLAGLLRPARRGPTTPLISSRCSTPR